ncbi:MAG: tRNA (adenosine(37)-N6)-threonylcarbamoyltransferase complex ATPase subunit type 1 TsaE, partial [Phycisphaeraceae bacterium]
MSASFPRPSTESPRLELYSAELADTLAIGRAIATLCREGDVLALAGELGAGKTQLVRGLAEGLGLDPTYVASPTFVFVHEYER